MKITTVLIIFLLIAAASLINCDGTDDTDCSTCTDCTKCPDCPVCTECEETNFTFGKDTTFVSQSIDTTVQSVHVTVDTLFVDTLYIPVDTLDIYDSIFVKLPDSLFLADTDTSPHSLDTLLISSDMLEEVDSIQLASPDSLFLFDSARATVTNEVLQIDTVETVETVGQGVFPICMEEQTTEAAAYFSDASKFLTYIVGNWEGTEIVKCEELIDISADYENFVIRFDVVSFNSSGVTLNYLSVLGQPFFKAKGQIIISSSEDFTADQITASLDGGKTIVFENLENNIDAKILDFSIEQIIECDDEGGRLNRLGTAKFRCDKF